MIEVDKIYCLDNLEGLRLIPDNFCKLCITSPPYNVGTNNIYEKGKEAKYENRNEDVKENYFQWLKPRLMEMIRTSEYVFFNIQMLSKNKVDVIELLYHFRDYYKDVIIWGKNGQPAMEIGVLNSCFEFIFIFEKNNPHKRKFYGYDFRGTIPNLINFGTNSKNKYAKVHKALFPESLPKFIIENFSKENDIIIDPFMGLGTVAISAKSLNRRYIGFELKQKYIDICSERLNNNVKP